MSTVKEYRVVTPWSDKTYTDKKEYEKAVDRLAGMSDDIVYSTYVKEVEVDDA